MKQAKRAFTNWPKPEIVLKGPDNVFCHVRKLPPDKFQMKPFGQENCYPRLGPKSHFGQKRFGQKHFGQLHFGQKHFGQSHFGQSHFGQKHFGQSHFGQSDFGQKHFSQSHFGQKHLAASFRVNIVKFYMGFVIVN